MAAIFPQDDGKIKTERTTGYVSDLVSKANGRFRGACVLIGQGGQHMDAVTDSNAHPHTSNDGKITIVHNGIIENSTILLERVKKIGYEVSSETDSELIVHLLHHEIENGLTDLPLEALRRVTHLLEGFLGPWQLLSAITKKFLLLGRAHH